MKYSPPIEAGASFNPPNLAKDFAPEYSHDSWVVERIRPGIGAGKNARPRIHEYLIKGQGWISDELWNEAKSARKRGKETKKQRELLDNGHWNVV